MQQLNQSMLLQYGNPCWNVNVPMPILQYRYAICQCHANMRTCEHANKRMRMPNVQPVTACDHRKAESVLVSVRQHRYQHQQHELGINELTYIGYKQTTSLQLPVLPNRKIANTCTLFTRVHSVPGAYSSRYTCILSTPN